jgi:hypothetical protein
MAAERITEFVSAGCDWLTCTTAQRSEAVRASTLATTLLKSEVYRGCIKKPWGMSGFSGWRAGAIEFGRRDDELIVRLSSHLAQTNWRKFYEMADSISRFDIQCTTRTAESAHRRIRRHFAEARRAASKRAKPPFVGHYRGNDGGETIYLNKRAGERFGRIYEKGVESGLSEFQNSVRYELEAKGEYAKILSTDVYRSANESVSIRTHLATFIRERGISLPRDWLSGNHSGCPRSRPSIERTLEWVQTSVRPTTDVCIRMGMLLEYMHALGLLDHDNLTAVRSCVDQAEEETHVSLQSDNKLPVLQSSVSERDALQQSG